MTYIKVIYDSRPCAYCGLDFSPNRRDKKYCKSSCQKAASAIRTDKVARDREKLSRRTDEKRRPYRKYVGASCEECGFVPQHICQLDVDHIDEDHANNDPSNLQTLCANCHRLKTHLNRSSSGET